MMQGRIHTTHETKRGSVNHLIVQDKDLLSYLHMIMPMLIAMWMPMPIAR